MIVGKSNKEIWNYTVMLIGFLMQGKGMFGSLAIMTLLLNACNGPAQIATTDIDNQTTATSTKVNAGSLDGIHINGSSTVYPITDLAAKEFVKSQDQTAQIKVEFAGTSEGFRQFCAGEIDINDASRPILLEEIEACNQAGVRFIELPLGFDALTVAVNPKNTWAKDITVQELTKLWGPAAQGKITNWNQIRPSYPNRPIKLFGAGKDSGTFGYFNEVTSGKSDLSRMDYTNSEDDDVLVEGIAQDSNALGYIPYAYFEANQNRLKGLAIDNGKGPVLPSRETVNNNQYQPFSRPLFIYVNSVAAQKKPELQKICGVLPKKCQNTGESGWLCSVARCSLPECQGAVLPG